jgi:hypothetical protein
MLPYHFDWRHRPSRHWETMLERTGMHLRRRFQLEPKEEMRINVDGHTDQQL